MKHYHTSFSSIMSAFVLIIFLSGFANSQTVQFGIFNVDGNLVIKLKSSANFSNNKLTGMLFTIRWLSSYGISLGDFASDYGMTKGGPEYNSGIYVYQKFYFSLDPQTIGWLENIEYQILSISINHTGEGQGTFELCPFGFTTNNTDPYVEIDAANHTNSTDPFYQSSTSMPLPVELTSFIAKAAKNEVRLKWQTATELNNFGFEIQKTVMNSKETNGPVNMNSATWKTISFVKGNGNSNSPKQYSYIDKNPEFGKAINYRLKQIDNDGQFSFSSIEVVKLEPLEFKLLQNYPNPFNPSTKICFTLPEACKIKIQIINLLGEKVKTLVDENKEAGYHEIDFNANKMSSGIYFYIMNAGSYSGTKKMILIK